MRISSKYFSNASFVFILFYLFFLQKNTYNLFTLKCLAQTENNKIHESNKKHLKNSLFFSFLKYSYFNEEIFQLNFLKLSLIAIYMYIRIKFDQSHVSYVSITA